MPKYSIAVVGSSGGGSATMSSGESILSLLREHVRVITSASIESVALNSPAFAFHDGKVAPKDDKQESKVRNSSSRRTSGIEYEDMLRFLCAGNNRRSSVFSPLTLTKSKINDNSKDNSYTVDLIACCFTKCDSGLDFLVSSEFEINAELWVICDGRLNLFSSGILNETNTEALKEDLRISELILDGKIDALISISSDPLKVNAKSVSAAIAKKIPIVGTGGTSMSLIATRGGMVIGSSGGSVATSATSKSICFAAALAAHWKLEYFPPIYSRGPSLPAIAGATLPIFLAMTVLKVSLRSVIKYADVWAVTFPSECVAQAILLSQQQISSLAGGLSARASTTQLKISQKILGKLSKLFEKVIKGVTSVPSLGASKNGPPVCIPTTFGYLVGILVAHSSRLIISLETRTLPLVVSTVACMEVSGLAELSMLSGAAAGSLVTESILAALVGGTVCGLLLPPLLLLGARRSLLPTAATIVAVGLSAVIGGLVAAALSHWTSLVTEAIRAHIWTLPTLLLRLIRADSLLTSSTLPADWLPLLYGAVIGWLASWGSERGLYHLVMLPLILVEMERADLSSFGALDLTCLCLPSAGVCAAVWVIARWRMSIMEPISTGLCGGPASGSGSDGRPEGKVGSDALDVHVRVGWRGVLSALVMGDFVEACYPYTSRCTPLLYTIRICCAMAGAIISKEKIRSSAYLPFPFALLLTYMDSNVDSVIYLFLAAFLCFMIPFTVALIFLPRVITNM